jgi:hypothetical protein
MINPFSLRKKENRQAYYDPANLTKEPEAPPPPELDDPVAIPDEEEMRKSRRRSLADQRLRRGRASTILTADGATDALGA